MITDRNKTELIEKYLRGELDGDLLNFFREKLSSDRAFLDEVNMQKELTEAIRGVGRDRLKVRFKSFHEDVLSYHSNNRRENRIPFYAVAATLSIVLLGLAYYLFERTTTAEEVFVAHYKPYPNTVFPNNRNGLDVISEEQQAFAYYDNGEFEKSRILFERIVEQEENEVARFYLGNVYLALGHTSKAINTFSAYLGKPGEYTSEATLYLSLAYIRENKLSDAADLLNRINDGNTQVNKSARDILEDLKRIK
jgi:tetratricopeptide (TPR) repeat protein